MLQIFGRNLGLIIALGVIVTFAPLAEASHSWGNYHWARSANPFTLQLGDNVSSKWDSYLRTASSDWSISSVLDTTAVSGKTNAKSCRPVSGRVEVCSSKYGYNGWLGVASIWASGDHITQGTVKLNDTYFNTSTYNTPPWRNLVMCQEIGHTFGLDHQDENFSNANLGTCMDYTNDPDGPPSNERPNAHDYEQLEIIYEHLDSTTTLRQLRGASAAAAAATNAELDRPAQWGEVLRRSSDGRPSLYVRDFGGGHKVFTFVTWAD